MPRKDLEARKHYEQHERPNKEARRIRIRDWNREYRKTDKFKAYQKKYRAENRRLTKGDKEVRVKESLVEQIWLAQNKCCAICKKPIPLRGRATHMDHNHKTGALRGLLCCKCNPAIGLFDEDQTRLAAAIEYLNKYNGQGDPEL